MWPLAAAATHPTATVAEKLIELGADVNFASECMYSLSLLVKFLYVLIYFTISQDGTTALHIAAIRGGLSVVQLLVRRGADINARTKFGQTPLHQACTGCRGPSFIRELVRLGADVNLVDQFGKPPIDIAAFFEEFGTVVALTDLGARVILYNNVRHKYSLSPSLFLLISLFITHTGTA
jgi:ankyrin repeat protein